MKRKIKKHFIKRKLWKRLKKDIHNNWDMTDVFLIVNFELFSEFFENHKNTIEQDLAKNEVYKEMKALYEWWIGYYPLMRDCPLNTLTSDGMIFDKKTNDYIQEKMLQRLLILRKDLWV